MGGRSWKPRQDNGDTVNNYVRNHFYQPQISKNHFFHNCKVFIKPASYYHKLQKLSCSGDKHFLKLAVQSRPVWTDLYVVDASEREGEVENCFLVFSHPGMPCGGGELLIEELLPVHKMHHSCLINLNGISLHIIYFSYISSEKQQALSSQM